MTANPFYIVTDDNPNEVYGVRACSFAGQQKSPDCGGVWRTWHSVPIGCRAVRLTVCDNHLQAAAADGHSHGYVAPAELHETTGMRTPTVKEIKPAKRARSRPLEDIVL